MSYRLDALQDDAFAPGRRLALVAGARQRARSERVGVWDDERRRPGRLRSCGDGSATSTPTTGRPSRCASSSRTASAAGCACCSRRETRGSDRLEHDDPRASARAAHAARPLLARPAAGPRRSTAATPSRSRVRTAGWQCRPGETFEPRDEQARRRARADRADRGARSARRPDARGPIDEVRAGAFGATFAAVDAAQRPARRRDGRRDPRWSLDAEAGSAATAGVRSSSSLPGVIGMPPDEDWHAPDRPAAPLRRQHRLHRARRGHDPLPSDLRRRRTRSRRETATRPGRR